MGRPRVGHIQFLNCLPLYYGLVRGGYVLDMDLRKGTPTELNQALLAGDLDISPISTVEYLRHASDLLLLPDLTVSSDGEVQSIVLVSKVPLAELAEGAAVALANTSATAGGALPRPAPLLRLPARPGADAGRGRRGPLDRGCRPAGHVGPAPRPVRV